MAEIKVEEGQSTRLVVLEAIGALMTAAFAFVAALAWNAAIQAILEEFLPDLAGRIGLTIYAVIVTVVAVIAIVLIGRALAKVSKLNLVRK